jgi:hydrogenase maturation protein HypF
MPGARRLRVRGVVQGVGFRPFVYRLARDHGITGWVRNDGAGVEVHAEGSPEALDGFVKGFEAPPPASRIAFFEVEEVSGSGCESFEIRDSAAQSSPTVRISPDLPVCAACLAELADPADRRYGYPYINCTDCGPRYSIVLGLPYDRSRTTMREWPMCADCAREYHDPFDRRFHAQPVACPICGPAYTPEISAMALLLRKGGIVAVKGLGGYHLAADARNAAAVAALRERKVRKEKPFALMAKDLATAGSLVDLSPEAEALLTSAARPVVLAPRRVELPGVAPDNSYLGVMLPYTPVHHLLFAAGAPEVLVMTSANRSSEPLAYRDEEAFAALAGIADAFLVGARPIARRVDDSIVRAGRLGPVVLRRARGLAPGAVARLPVAYPVLAVGADLKNTVTLVVGGEAFVSQHIGDLRHYEALRAFRETIQDLLQMYAVDTDELVVAHDLHPQYASTAHALELPAKKRIAVQHHRAHVAGVLAERGAFDVQVLGLAFDGTGYGDDGAIWGGEFFAGSLRAGFARVGHLRSAVLPGGDAAAGHPVQAAAGFLAGLDSLPDLTAPPFRFPERYRRARDLIAKGVRTFPTTSMGRLFDTVAALLGFNRETTFEGQAALWVEQLARRSPPVAPFPMPFESGQLDFRPLLQAVLEGRVKGRSVEEIARAFHAGLATGIRQGIVALGAEHAAEAVVLSGGVFQNELLLEELIVGLAGSRLAVWMGREVPPNDGGISLGQAALVERG